MQRIAIPYGDTGRFSRLVVDYLQGAPGLRQFYQWPPDLQGLEQAAHARRYSPAARTTLCDALERQYVGIDLHPAVRANLDRLRQQATLTVTTGHQLCLFTGPLYVPFKILNVVRLARRLSTAERPVVPVFWMATEDHDRAEIDHAWINGNRVAWPGEAAGAVGDMLLLGIGSVLDTAEEAFGPGTHADELRALLRACYRPEYTLAQATRRFVNALFGRFGVVVLDGDDHALKSLFVPVMREELINQVALRSVEYADQKLEGHWRSQAHARNINLFYLRPGKRDRIELEDGRFRVLGEGPVFDLDGLLTELETHPERFSPNVLLRPVYQETILPNVAYVGGGGELAYWFQLRWLFQAVQTPMPVLMLRTSAGFYSAKDAGRMRGLGLQWPDMFRPAHELNAHVAKEMASFPVSVENERQALQRFYAGLKERAIAADPTLEGAANAIGQRALNGLEAFGKKLVAAAKREQQAPLDQLELVRGHLFPGNGLQERRENFIPWYAKEGPAFFDRLLDALDPLDARFSLLPNSPGQPAT